MGNRAVEVIKYQVYGVFFEGNIEWQLTTNVKIDLAYWYDKEKETLLLIEQKLSIGHGRRLIECLQKVKQQYNINHLQKILVKCQLDKKLALDYVLTPTTPGFTSYKEKFQKLMSILEPSLAGKILLLNEIIKFNIEENQIISSFEELTTFIQTGRLLGRITDQPGVTYPYKNEALQCNRCGSKEKIIYQSCKLCDEQCATCESCISTGRSKTCTPLLSFPTKTILNKIKLDDIEPNHNQISLTNSQLTIYQENIANKTLDFLQDNVNHRLLIWAVTGAGKTEMIFPAIHYALLKGKKILVASPRRDVIKELLPRFKREFTTKIVGLYGGSKEKWEAGELYLATTHQAIRFENYFDLVCIDEIDAFPYHNNPTLQFAVTRALKENGKIIFLTATPSKEWEKNIRNKEVITAILPRRYHNYPLPIPNIRIIPKREKLLKTIKPHPLIVKFIELVNKENGQALIFLPSIKDIGRWTERLKEWFPKEKIEGVYANDPKRDTTVEKFRNGRITFLVTTTIMERGITIPNLHVLVVGAEAKVFDKATLIQIAGRVGRAKEYPDGHVHFLAEYKNEEMVRARKEIKKMNGLKNENGKNLSILEEF